MGIGSANNLNTIGKNGVSYLDKLAKVNIRTEHSKIKIDQTKCFESIGIKSARVIAKESAQKSYNSALQYIRKVAQDGDRLASVEKGGNPIAEIAKRDSIEYKDYNVGIIPKVRPEISVEGGVYIDVRV